MYKVFGFLFFVVLCICPAGPTIAQETNTDLRRLLQEGIELTSAGQLPQAVRALEEAVKLDPEYADAYAALGRAYFKMRQWQSAAHYLRHAAALNAKQRVAKNASPKEPALVKPALVKPELPEPRQNTNSETPPIVNSPLASTQPPRAPDLSTIGTPPAMKLIAVEVTQQTSPEEKQEPTADSVSMSASPTSSPVAGAGVSPIPLKPSNEDVSLTKVYRVGPGDVLDVRINEGEPRQSTLFTVTSAGMLEHPILAEPLRVSALTTEEIATKIQDDVKKRALIEHPEVTVGVRDYASHTILVSGLVKDSGTKFLRREAIPLYVVVADAQPLPEAARVTVVRNEQNQMFEIDLTNVADMNLLVRPGDVIHLQPKETQFVYVGGEVKAPGEKIFRRGLTLMQAILAAGGATPKSKVAEIGRDDGEGFLVKTSYMLKDIQTGKAMDPLVRAGDRIMIVR